MKEKTVLPTSVERKSAGKMQHRRKKCPQQQQQQRDRERWQEKQQIVQFVLDLHPDHVYYHHSCQNKWSRKLPRAVFKNCWNSDLSAEKAVAAAVCCAVLCCVLLIKVAGKLHKVIMRSYSCCPTYDGIKILDRVEKGHGSLNQHVYPTRYKVVQRSFQHSWSIILVGWIQMDWEEGDRFSWIQWTALDSSRFWWIRNKR